MSLLTIKETQNSALDSKFSLSEKNEKNIESTGFCDSETPAQPSVRKNSAKLSLNTTATTTTTTTANKTDMPSIALCSQAKKTTLKLGFKVAKNWKDNSFGCDIGSGGFKKFSIFLVTKTWEIHLKLFINTFLFFFLVARVASMIFTLLLKYIASRITAVKKVTLPSEI